MAEMGLKSRKLKQRRFDPSSSKMVSFWCVIGSLFFKSRYNSKRRFGLCYRKKSNRASLLAQRRRKWRRRREKKKTLKILEARRCRWEW